MQSREFRYHGNNHGQQIEKQRLLPVVAAMDGQQKGHHRNRREEFARRRILHAVVKLLPKRQLVIFALI